MKTKHDWRDTLSDDELLQLAKLDGHIDIQTAAVAAHPGNNELLATLALLKHRRYLLQSKAAQRLKRMLEKSPRRAA